MNMSAYIALYSSAILLAFNGLFSNGMELDSSSMTHIRSIFAGITISAFILFSRGHFRLPDRKSLGIVYLIGLLMGLHWITYFYAMKSSSVAIGMLSLYTFPVMIVLIEPFFNGKKIQWLDIGLSIVVLFGLFIILSDKILFAETDNNISMIYGVIVGLISALCFALRNLLQKYFCPQISSNTLMFHQLIVIVVMTIPFIDLPAIGQLPLIDWGYLVTLGVFTTALAHTLLVKSYKVFPAKMVAMVSCLTPAIGAILAWLVLGEALTLTTILGGAIILAVALYESAQANHHGSK